MRNTSFAGERTKEDKAGWSSFLKHLKERGFTGVQLIISDACMGLAESAVEFLPEARCSRAVFARRSRNAYGCLSRFQLRRCYSPAIG